MQYHPSDQQVSQYPYPHQNLPSQLYSPYNAYPPYSSYQPYPPYPPPQTFPPPYPSYPPPQPYSPYISNSPYQLQQTYFQPQFYSQTSKDQNHSQNTTENSNISLIFSKDSQFSSNNNKLPKISYKSFNSENRKLWFLHPNDEDTNNHTKIRDLQNSKDFPVIIYDDNYIYKLDFAKGDTGYYYCINKNIKNIKCSARRIYKNGELEMPSKRENFFHESDTCKVQNFVASEQIKNQLFILRLNVRNFYLKNRQMTIRDIHYEFKKCHYSCTISQIEYWLKDLINNSIGKYSHLKFMKDDLNPNENRLWCRLNDEVNNIMLFMTDLHEDILIDSDVWLIDGTFRTSPRNFNQVLNIMAVNTLKKIYYSCSYIIGWKKRVRIYFCIK